MQINQATFAAVVETAKAKAAGHPEWLRSIEKAAKLILSGELIVTTLASGALVTSSNGTYSASSHCNCAARTRHCYHIAAARLVDLYETEVATQATFVADVAESPRQHLIVEIENIWNRVEPTVHLADALVARFGKNKLDMLPTEMLKDIRLAIA